MRTRFCFSFLLIFATSISFAYQKSEKLPYYGSSFYQALATNAESLVVKENIQKTIGQHTPLDYDRVRIFILGGYYLTNHGGNNYGLRDLYCDNEKVFADFPKGGAPGPGKIPTNEVINIEHTWPQSHFSKRFPKGHQKADLHHLFPTDSKVNSTRSNYRFGDVAKDTKQVKCGASRFGETSSGTKNTFEPPRPHKGNVARALFYFSVRYNLPIGDEEEASLRKWSKEDRVDEEELDRNNEIFKLQKNRNPFIDNEGLEDRITDF